MILGANQWRLVPNMHAKQQSGAPPKSSICMIEQELGNLLPIEVPLATILTMVEVDRADRGEMR
jgi:hypothetical protein